MTCACMETGRERRDQKIPSSTLAFGQSELYSRYFLNLGSGFVLRSPVIGKGISVRTSSQKWPSWTGWGNANTGSRLAPSLPMAIMAITEHSYSLPFMSLYGDCSLLASLVQETILGKEQSRDAVACPRS